MSSYLEGQETGEEEEDDRAEHDHDLPPAPGHRGGLLPLARPRPRPRPVVLARAARVRRHLHCRVSITRLSTECYLHVFLKHLQKNFVPGPRL